MRTLAGAVLAVCLLVPGVASGASAHVAAGAKKTSGCGWARPKMPIDTTRALTRDQVDALVAAARAAAGQDAVAAAVRDRGPGRRKSPA